jgi:hypothetical protein
MIWDYGWWEIVVANAKSQVYLGVKLIKPLKLRRKAVAK